MNNIGLRNSSASKKWALETSTSTISYFKDEYVAKVVSRFLGQDATKENESIDPDVGKKECKDDTNVKKDRPSRTVLQETWSTG